MNCLEPPRILLIDDTPAIHDDFRKILAPPETGDLDDVEAALFGGGRAARSRRFDLDSAYQGAEGLAKVAGALAAGRPYALAFVDMRMPPGWDGVETIARLWEQDPLLQVVICTAYTDYSWDEVLARLEVGDRLLILKKPFDPIEVSQLAGALTAKRRATHQASLKMSALEGAVAARTAELSAANAALQAEMDGRRQLEGQLVQSEKLASLGQLAAGIAHEINNPLGFIVTNFGILNGHVDALFSMLAAYEGAAVSPELDEAHRRLEIGFIREDTPDLLRETRDGILRVRQIVQDLKDFSRVNGSQDWELADLHRGFDATLNIVANEVKYKADLVRDYGELPEVECLPSQLNQVVMNLVVNASHAMGAERGTITLRTRAEGDWVAIEVADTGSGIPPEVLPRIFDPFFTTKPVGKGTGLGLSISYGIVRKHGGRIEVDSEPGRGTAFRVVLPVRQETPVQELASEG